MSDYIGVVTNAGQAKIAAAIGGTALNLATIRVGDGNGAPIVPNPAMTDLVRRVGAAYPIVSSGRDPVNANHWRVTALIPVDEGPFDIREIGVWDAAGEMIAVARHVLVEKRTPAQGAAVELLTDIVFPVSETAQVTVQVTPSAQISIFQMLRAGFMVVESATLANPPGAPALGRTHVVPAGATGAWIGLAGMLVQWNGIAWVAVDAPIGFHVVDQSKGIDTGSRWLERTATGWKVGISRLLQKQPGNYISAVGGTADSLTVTLDPAPTSWADLIGVPLRVMIANGNTSAAPTLLPDGLAGAKTIVKPDGSPVAAGDTKGLKEFLYDGVNVRLIGLAPSSSGRLIGIQTFTTSGTYTPTPGMTFCIVEGVGGGGAGGGGTNPSAGNVSAGAPGTAGTWGKAGITASSIGASKAVTIGAGGAGVSGAAGGDGGSTVLATLLTLPGGKGGGVLNNQVPPTSNGNGVVSAAATGANIASRSGTAPNQSVGYSSSQGTGAPGGDSPLGAGGYGISANVNGTAAFGNGGGGSGVCLIAGGGNGTGGNGSPGLLIILEYGP